MINLNNLKRMFEYCIDQHIEFIGVAINMKDMQSNEIIINPNCNFKSKLEYYLKAYNDDLTLKANNDIRIVGFSYGENFGDIQEDLDFIP